jgi:hypothetical protein
VGLSNSEIGVTYQLKKDNVNEGTDVAGTGVAISFGNKTAAGTYTVVATRTLGGCTNDMTGSVTATVTPTVVPSISIASSPSGVIIAGTSVTFTATPINGGSTPSYQWKKNNTNVGTNSATYSDATLVTNDSISCVLTSNDGCASPMIATSNSIAISVCIAPTVYSVTGGGAYCAGGIGVAVGLSNSEIGVTYQLKKDNVNEGTDVAGTGVAISFGNKTAAGTYTVVATRTVGGCTNDMIGSVTTTVAPQNLVVTNNVSTGNELVKAVQTIQSDRTIGVPIANPAPYVIYEAGSSITLLPGFMVERQSVFKAEIKGCP